MNKFLYLIGELLVNFSKKLVALSENLMMPHKAELMLKFHAEMDRHHQSEMQALLDRCEAVGKAQAVSKRKANFKIIENGQTKSVQQFLEENQADYEVIFGKKYVSN